MSSSKKISPFALSKQIEKTNSKLAKKFLKNLIKNKKKIFIY